MATEGRPPRPPVEPGGEPTEIERLLREAPFTFEFFQAVRLLAELTPDRQPVGEFSNPAKECVHFGANADPGFPASQIAGIDWSEGSPPAMRVNFMGLTGPNGVLPLVYSMLVRQRERAHDTAPRDFFDIFNHRAISLFYRAWKKHRAGIACEHGESDRFAHHLLDLVGLGTKGLERRQSVPDFGMLFYAGLLGPHTRSAAALEQLLTDYFDVPVEVEQFVGGWHTLDTDTQCRLEASASYSGQLGAGAVVGREVWDQQSGVRLRLGPLTLAQYRDFLPDGAAYEPLRALVRFFAGDELDFEVQLVLRKDQAPACALGDKGDTAPRLGWLTWVRTKPLEQDPEGIMLRL